MPLDVETLSADPLRVTAEDLQHSSDLRLHVREVSFLIIATKTQQIGQSARVLLHSV